MYHRLVRAIQSINVRRAHLASCTSHEDGTSTQQTVWSHTKRIKHSSRLPDIFVWRRRPFAYKRGAGDVTTVTEDLSMNATTSPFPLAPLTHPPLSLHAETNFSSGLPGHKTALSIALIISESLSSVNGKDRNLARTSHVSGTFLLPTYAFHVYTIWV